MTLIILPRVAGPTGIEMGRPVSVHTFPLTRPSVPSIAIVRTVFSPSKLNEPPHDKTSTITCVFSEDSDQPGRPPSLHCPHEETSGP